MSLQWTNAEAIQQWSTTSREHLESWDPDGDFSRQHLINRTLLRILGDVRGRRILDVGCGQGYLCRKLADLGADMVGLEPSDDFFAYAVEKEAERQQGIRYIQADAATVDDLGAPYDFVLANVVLSAIPDWRSAMRTCAEALAPGGRFVFVVNHPCFENLWTTWRTHGAYRIDRYLEEYEIRGGQASDFHRTLSAYLNEVAGLGLRLVEIAEPGLDPDVAKAGPDGIESYVHLPNFLVVVASKT